MYRCIVHSHKNVENYDVENFMFPFKYEMSLWEARTNAIKRWKKSQLS